MKRRLTILLVGALLLIFCGCSAKLTTVRPAEISEMRVERIADGTVITLPSDRGDADLKDWLIFQLEEPYDAAGDCTAADGHCYRVSLYIGDRLDTEVLINADGSVCQDGKRHVPSDQAERPVRVKDYDALFVDFAAGESDLQTPTEEQVEDSAGAGESDLQTPTEEQPAGPAVAIALPTAAAELEVVACQGEGQALPPEVEILHSIPAVDVLPWSYTVSDVRYNGQDLVMVWRDTPKGDAEWLCSVAQTGGDTALRHQIEYVEGSFERSGERFLYFTITDAATFHRSLWCFDLETNYFNNLLEKPCSNMLLLEHEPQDAQGIGWIVYDHYLAAIDLAWGSTYEGLTIDLADYIEDSLFYGIGAFGTHKFAQLYDLGNYSVEIMAITAEPETSAPELTARYQFDLLTLKFAAL